MWKSLPECCYRSLDSMNFRILFVSKCKPCISFSCGPRHYNRLWVIGKLVIVLWLCKANHFPLISVKINNIFTKHVVRMRIRCSYLHKGYPYFLLCSAFFMLIYWHYRKVIISEIGKLKTPKINEILHNPTFSKFCCG